MKVASRNLPIIDVATVNTHDEAKLVIDSMCQQLSTIMHDSCTKTIIDAPNRYLGLHQRKKLVESRLHRY